MGLIPAQRIFALRRTFTSMLFLSINETMAITNETKSDLLLQVWNAFNAMSKTLDAKPGFENLTQHALIL